jgi:hypothetical protein
MRIILLAGIAACSAVAQSSVEPPPIIQVLRKIGTRTPPARQYSGAGAAINVLGMTAITGSEETWLVECHQSFDSIENLDKGLAAVAPRVAGDPSDIMPDDVLPPAKTLIAFYRPGWSYRAEQAVRMLPRARYFHVTIYRLRAGAEADFGELIRLRRLNLDSVNLDRPDLAYQVISGAPSGTYLFLAPLVSLRTMDDAVASLPLYAENLPKAEVKTADRVSEKLEMNREHLLFRVEPRISYVSDDFAEADPEFWRGRPAGGRQ